MRTALFISIFTFWFILLPMIFFKEYNIIAIIIISCYIIVNVLSFRHCYDGMNKLIDFGFATIAGWFGNTDGFSWLQDIATMLSPGQPVYVLIYATAIIFFCFFYTALVFNSKETAENLKKSGAFLPGIRPGIQTSNYIDKVMTRLTLIGAFYITLVCLLPEFLIVYWNVPFYFGGTSLLIIVVVVMDFISQIQTHVMSQQYEGLMKKSNLKK